MGTLGWRKGKWIKPRSETLSDMFKIKMCVSETSELTKRQLSAQTENKMVDGGAGDKISKLCADQATKNVLEDGSTEPVWAHWDGEKANG